MTGAIVHLVRHGEVHNPAGVVYGRMPGFALSTRGHAMARSVSDHLAGRDLACVVSSPLLRARQTAAYIARPHNLVPHERGEATEALNVLEGKRARASFASLVRYGWVLRNPIRPSWGERFESIASRMAGLIDSLLVDTLFVENPGRELVIVSHQAPIGTLVRYLTGQRLWHLPSTRRCALASVTTVAIELPVERPVELPVELAVAPTTARGRHPAQPRGVVLDYWVPADTIERSAG